MPAAPICLWCREVLDESHSPDECRAQILAQDGSDPALRMLRTVLTEEPMAPAEHRGAYAATCSSAQHIG
jgi:hypothetical protein